MAARERFTDASERCFLLRLCKYSWMTAGFSFFKFFILLDFDGKVVEEVFGQLP
jgi:hypothetical protein